MPLTSNPLCENRYLYHWLTVDRLEKFANRSVLTPYWQHWVYDRGGFMRGISTSADPMAWHPKEAEGSSAEPCIVIDKTAFDHDFVELDSSETYHLTQRVKEGMKKGLDVDKILADIPGHRRITFGLMDEIFILSPIPASAIAAVGYEPARMYFSEVDAISEIADHWQVPLLNMDGWEDYAPDVEFMDHVVLDAIEKRPDRHYQQRWDGFLPR